MTDREDTDPDDGVTDREDGPEGRLPDRADFDPEREPSADPPTITCSRCDREWTLDFELDELQVGNRAFERFALDHHRHTGHYPDGVTPWRVTCRQCPEREQFLAERPARRHAQTHARHTEHTVELDEPDGGDAEMIEPADVPE